MADAAVGDVDLCMSRSAKRRAALDVHGDDGLVGGARAPGLGGHAGCILWGSPILRRNRAAGETLRHTIGPARPHVPMSAEHTP